MPGQNGLENCYVIKQNKRLHCGYTTGSCAAAAAKAATWMLLGGEETDSTDLMTPKGILLHLPVEDVSRSEEAVSCAVRKDGGDDPDATHGLLIYARVERIPSPEIILEGGEGVGRVTKKGLEQPVGAPAINQVPRRMIREAVTEICDRLGYMGGLLVTVYVPKGEETAKKTFNPRLGIQGGISILGTSGIVVPMSEEALTASIRLEMEVRRAAGDEYLLITPGNYGEQFLRQRKDLDLSKAMKCSNFVGETVDFALELGMKGILFVAHIGKFIKVSGGMMNTHSRNGDARAELMAAQAIRAGASLSLVQKLLETITTEEAVELLEEAGMTEPVMKQVLERIVFYLQNRCRGELRTEVILFSGSRGLLGETEGAKELLERFLRKEEE